MGKAPQKQPYLGNAGGPYGLADVEVWTWRAKFLNAALETRPAFAPGQTFAQVLLKGLRPAWVNAESAYKAEAEEVEQKALNSGRSFDHPLSASWCASLLLGRQAHLREFDVAWWSKLRAWPAIQAAARDTRDLLMWCNLDGYPTGTRKAVDIPWIEDTLIDTIERWLSPFNDRRSSLPLSLPGSVGLHMAAWRDGKISSPFAPEATPFVHLSFDPLTQSAASWRALALQGFKAYLTEHEGETMKAAEALTAAGTIVRTAKKREAEHFGWLASYQVEGASFTHLAHEKGLSQHAVRGAIERTAGLIGLPLRKPYAPGHGSGRPKKNG